MKVADVAEAEIEAIEGQGSADVTIDNPPLCVAPGYKAVVAKSMNLKYQDQGLHGEILGFTRPFPTGGIKECRQETRKRHGNGTTPL
jgi:hypothetical protein